MAVGKNSLALSQTFVGDVQSSLDDIYSAMLVLSMELAVTPGFATLIASAAITKGTAVNISAGKVRLADAAAVRPAIGVAVTGAAIGQKARIMLGMGYISGLSGLTAGASVYTGNAGALLFAKPGAGMIQGIGFALSATELFVTISQP